MSVSTVKSSAVLSQCRKYRYVLSRTWGDDDRPAMVFIGLNPSTADESSDDPTIRRCMAFAKSWGYHGMHMLNLFALRATNPKEMLAHSHPVGEENDYWICRLTQSASLVVAVWGAHGVHQQRDRQVMSLLERPVHCLRLTATGMPGHPLYLPKHLVPIEFRVSQ